MCAVDGVYFRLKMCKNMEQMLHIRRLASNINRYLTDVSVCHTSEEDNERGKKIKKAKSIRYSYISTHFPHI